MLISKFDLYDTEWLDVVFADRNKAYGAYELRQHYSVTMAKAMAVTFFAVALLCGATILFKAAAPTTRIISVDNTPIVPKLPLPAEPIKKIEKPQTVKPFKAPAPAPAVATQRVVPPVVVPDNQAQTPIKNIDITEAIGTENTKGTHNPGEAVSTDPAGNGVGVVPDNSVHTLDGLEFMPEPIGGAAAWAKFLGKNLRFPPAAQEDGVSGRVILSFIIEKDGSLSSIAVDRPAGHGFDEEALRVLKLAKAWKPGMQNGRPVRVKYEIPINFQLSEE